MKKTSAVTLILISFVLTACNSTFMSLKLNSVERQQLKQVALTPISMPDTMGFRGDGSQYYEGVSAPTTGGTISVMAQIEGAEVRKSGSERIQQSYPQLKKSIQTMLQREVTFQLQTKKQIAINAHANTFLKIQVTEYSYSPTALGLGMKLRPQMKALAELIKNNKVIWRSSAALGLSNFATYSLKELEANPKLIEKQWSDATKSIVKSLVDNLE